MPMTDTVPMQGVDVRGTSSDWLMTCPTHGTIRMGIQFNGEWARTYCGECFEEWIPSICELVTIDPNGGPPPEGLISEGEG